jgi:hypothetical protein
MKRNKWLCCALFSAGMAMGLSMSPSDAEAQRKRGTEIKLNDIKVVGKIQKPQAFYVLSRAPLNYQNFQQKRSLIKKVIEAVRKAPF